MATLHSTVAGIPCSHTFRKGYGPSTIRCAFSHSITPPYSTVGSSAHFTVLRGRRGARSSRTKESMAASGLSRWWYSMELVQSMIYQPLPSSYIGPSTNTTVRKVMVRQQVAMYLRVCSQRGSSRPVKMHTSCPAAVMAQTAAAKMLEFSV